MQAQQATLVMGNMQVAWRKSNVASVDISSDPMRSVALNSFEKFARKCKSGNPWLPPPKFCTNFAMAGTLARHRTSAGLLDGIWKAQALLKCSGNMECHLQLVYGFGDGVRRVGRHLYKVGKLWDGFFNGCCKNDPTPSLFDCLPGWVGLRNGAVIALGALDAGLETAEKGDTVAPRKAQEACRSGNPCMHMFM